MTTPIERERLAWFDKEAEGYSERHPEPTDSLEPLLAILPLGSRILDVGCGPGVDAAHMARHGHRVTGIDAAPRMIAVAQRTFPAVEFRHADVRALPFPPASFDAITALYSLIFMPKRDLVGVLRELAKLLVPHGHLLLVAQGGKPAELEEEFFTVMTPDEIAGYVQAAGYEIVCAWDRAPREGERPFRKLHVLARRR